MRFSMRRCTHRFCSARDLLAFVLLVFGAALAAAADNQWAALSDPVFQRIAASAGAQATAISQDAKGFIWVGTQSGLFRWDGYKLHPYMAKRRTPGALPDSFVNALHSDAQGRLWIATSAGGLCRYDGERDSFDTLPVKSARGDGLSHHSVFALADDGEGGLWVGTGAGLDHLMSDGKTLRPHASHAQKHGLPTGSVLAVLLDGSGGLWIGMRDGLYRRKAGTEEFVLVELPVQESRTPSVTRLLEDASRRIWVGTRPDGAFVLDRDTGAVRQLEGFVRNRASRDLRLPGNTILAMAEAAPGEVWLGTDGAGIVRINTRDWTSHHVRHMERVPASLADDDVFALFRDRNGLLWVSTESGVATHDPRARGVVNLFGGTGSASKISHPNVASLLAMSDGAVWLGLGDGGIDILDPRRGRIGQLRPDAAKVPNALPPGRVLSMAQSPSGEVYLGTQQGLYKAKRDGREVVRVRLPQRKQNVPVWAIEFIGNRLWLGGLDGLWCFEPSDIGSWRLVQHEDERLGDSRVTVIQEDGANGLWIGTKSGLAHLRGDGTLEPLPEDGPGHAGIPQAFVSGVVTDRNGRVWVASFGAGVSVMERSADRGLIVRRISVNEGLPHNGVDALALDASGNAWVSTDGGIARIDGSNLAVWPFHAAEGAGLLTHWTTAVATAKDGALLFGAGGGLTIVQPDLVQRWKYRPPVVITEASTGDDESLNAYAIGGPGRQAITVQPPRRNLLVEFAALDYSSPEKIRYAYRLVGLDDTWRETGASRRLATYTNLPPGKYSLELRGTNRAGEWSDPLTLPVQVLATWYETAWFKAILTALGASLVVLLVQVRTIYLRRQQRMLQALVEQRTAQLKESQHMLEQMAFFDPLTGLANRRLFNEDMQRLVAQVQRGKHAFALLLVDLDRFKQINDTLGHRAGDALLATIGERLNEIVRGADRVARLGGDEFAVLLSDTTDRDAIDAVCARIVDRLSQPVRFEDSSMQVGVSIGVACCPGDADSVDALYKAGDEALYEAKAGGRGVWRWHAA